MSSKNKYSLGVDLGGTNIKIGIVSDQGKLITSTSVKTEAEFGPKKIISNMIYGIETVLKQCKCKIQGIGIGCPGVVSTKKGIIENAPNLPGWKDIKLSSLISKKFGYDVFVENDANAAAIGELMFGAGKKYPSFVMITLGTGVGGGIVYKKKIYRGELGAAGEIGHVSIDVHGPKCNCGSTGCIESYIGNQYLKEIVKNEIPNHPDSKIWDLIENDTKKISPRLIQKALELGDEYAMSIVIRMGSQLGVALASLANIMDISTFIIGGGMSGFGAPLFDSTKATINSRVMESLRSRIKVIPAKLKNEAGIKGASSLVFYKK